MAEAVFFFLDQRKPALFAPEEVYPVELRGNMLIENDGYELVRSRGGKIFSLAKTQGRKEILFLTQMKQIFFR